MARAQGGSHETAEQQGPGSTDAANAANANPSAEQVTQSGGEAPAEGQRIREDVRKDAKDRGVVSLNDVIVTGDKNAVKYDETGALVDGDGNRIALAADATDPDVGWTVQQARAEKAKDRVAYPGGPASVPDQTYHPDELPDPVAALRAGLLPQNTEVLNVDPDKFKGKKPLEA